MQLVQEGTLRLDGTLGEYLPALYAGTPAAAVTVAQLLNHTSGIADLPRSYEDPVDSWHAAERAGGRVALQQQWLLPARPDHREGDGRQLRSQPAAPDPGQGRHDQQRAVPRQRTHSAPGDRLPDPAGLQPGAPDAHRSERLVLGRRPVLHR
ncbi:hypothetical protein G6F21_014245 [Rhizopus arrhizus]|nr:hypothetical protein G6F21_014245 [Rhizopus arrhizus]